MRGRSHKQQVKRSRLEISQRSVKGWNNLPSDVVAAQSVSALKSKPDRYKKEEWGI
jgi:hypothetical protein